MLGISTTYLCKHIRFAILVLFLASFFSFSFIEVIKDVKSELHVRKAPSAYSRLLPPMIVNTIRSDPSYSFKASTSTISGR